MGKVYRFIALFLILGSVCNASAQYATRIVVAQDGSGDHTSIQAAINRTKSFPDKPITIFIKKGVYREKVRVYAWNTHLTFEGEDRDSTIIEFDDHFKKINKGRNSTFLTYTLSVEANDFTAKNLTIANRAGAVGQALALSVSGDRCTFENCRIIGNQDTLYCTGDGFRQYFVKCHIEGTTDFIFGNATALFEECVIHSKANSYITAASTTERQEYGLVFLRCQLTASEGIDKVYLGRPWRAHARTAFIDCEYGSHILPKGWSEWGKGTNHLSAFYAEFTSANNSNRAVWAIQLSKRQAKKYRKSVIFKNWK